ncbi:hypothetical protein [Methanosarcina sp. 1.H.A.2.2]|nr:hypothetical protein [Methanosarcina sp. 1.H.A.2.2]
MSEAKRTVYCCDYIATPRKSPISCNPEAQFGRGAIRVEKHRSWVEPS